MTPELIAKWWGQDPLTSSASEETGISAALWNFNADRPVEIVGEPDPSTHVLSIHTRAVQHESFLDEKCVYSSPTGRGTTSLVLAGVRPRSILLTGFGCLQLYVPDVAVQSLAGKMIDCNGVELVDPSVTVDHQMWTMGRSLITAMQRGDISTRVQFDSLTQAIVAQLIARWSNRSERALRALGRPTGRLAVWQLRRVEEKLRAGLASQISLSDMAAEAHLSAFHFGRCFKATTGETPHRFLVRIRIERARALLEETDLPVAEISASVGYDDPAYLARLFNKEVGVTPTEYRRERRS